MKHSNRRLAVSLSVAAVAVVALAGCAAPTSTATPQHASSSTPTPAPKAAAAPGSRVPLKCADLMTPATVAAVVGVSVTVTTDESTPAKYLGDLASAQLGSLACVWSGQDGSDYGPFAREAIYIAPDSSNAFSANYAKNMSDVPAGYAATVTNTVGTESGYRCGSAPEFDGDGESFGCDAQMLVSSYWVSVYVSGVAPSTTATVTSGTESILTAVAERLRTAGEPRTTAWVPSTTSTPNFCASSSAAAAVNTAMGVSDFAPAPAPTPPVDAGSVALDGRDDSCTFTSATRGAVNIQLLAGGSWAFPGFHPVGLPDDVVQTFASASVPGVTGLELGCSQGDCEAYFAVGSTAAFVSFSDLGPAKNTAAIAALAKDFAPR
jgi:hypothetical protein